MLKEDAEIFKQKRFFEEQVIFSFAICKNKVVEASVPKLKRACTVCSCQLMELYQIEYGIYSIPD